MIFTEHLISYCGRNSISIELPVFSDEEDPDCALRMNLFYSVAADKIFVYAMSLYNEDNRRSFFLCRYSVDADDDAVNVKLSISYSAQNGNSRTASVRRSIVHTWKRKRAGGGYFITESLAE